MSNKPAGSIPSHTLSVCNSRPSPALSLCSSRIGGRSPHEMELSFSPQHHHTPMPPFGFSLPQRDVRDVFSGPRHTHAHAHAHTWRRQSEVKKTLSGGMDEHRPAPSARCCVGRWRCALFLLLVLVAVAGGMWSTGRHRDGWTMLSLQWQQQCTYHARIPRGRPVPNFSSPGNYSVSEQCEEGEDPRGEYLLTSCDASDAGATASSDVLLQPEAIGYVLAPHLPQQPAAAGAALYDEFQHLLATPDGQQTSRQGRDRASDEAGEPLYPLWATEAYLEGPDDGHRGPRLVVDIVYTFVNPNDEQFDTDRDTIDRLQQPQRAPAMRPGPPPPPPVWDHGDTIKQLAGALESAGFALGARTGTSAFTAACAEYLQPYLNGTSSPLEEGSADEAWLGDLQSGRTVFVPWCQRPESAPAADDGSHHPPTNTVVTNHPTGQTAILQGDVDNTLPNASTNNANNARTNNATRTCKPNTTRHRDGGESNRVRDWGELRHSLEALRAHVLPPAAHRGPSTIGKVHLVVSHRSQVPAYAYALIPNLHVVEHRALFPNPRRALPTVNSYAIESVLHRIPGLARHFITFNNDMMIARPLSFFDVFVPFAVGDAVRYLPAIFADDAHYRECYRARWGVSRTVLRCGGSIGGGYRAPYDSNLMLLQDIFWEDGRPARRGKQASDGPTPFHRLLSPPPPPTEEIRRPEEERLQWQIDYAHMPHMVDRDIYARLMAHPALRDRLCATRGARERSDGNVFPLFLYHHYAAAARFGGVHDSPAMQPPAGDRKGPVPAFVDALGRRRLPVAQYVGVGVGGVETQPLGPVGEALRTVLNVFATLPGSGHSITTTALPRRLLPPPQHRKGGSDGGQESPAPPQEVARTRNVRGSTDHWLVDVGETLASPIGVVALRSSIRYYFAMVSDQAGGLGALQDAKPRTGRLVYMTVNDDLTVAPLDAARRTLVEAPDASTVVAPLLQVPFGALHQLCEIGRNEPEGLRGVVAGISGLQSDLDRQRRDREGADMGGGDPNGGDVDRAMFGQRGEGAGILVAANAAPLADGDFATETAAVLSMVCNATQGLWAAELHRALLRTTGRVPGGGLITAIMRQACARCMDPQTPNPPKQKEQKKKRSRRAPINKATI